VAEIAIVISNHADARAVERARQRGLPVTVIERAAYPSRTAQHTAIAEALRAAGVDLVVAAGFDRILEPVVVEAFADRIINIHPSLLPAFPGLHAQAQALEYGVKIAGCTVHFVTQELDAGPIILQAAVPVHEDDTVETLAARILAEEHRILPQAIQLFAEGRLQREGRRVRIKEA
jgi:phosphoribosylglycinamide formyltransferase-1